ncbi:LysR family transcriptional regulator [Rhizosaccharibacter radicis]|uniref:LysR family transcriptional regulator n=1 Tax=Rhizosaccharibacter radicis TaxID=2782605 RepID=A0ABT1VSM7_9PROT|nr:LysR family transcriptional regulator [Acetobacteraceae bacterium KSS12]
MELFVRVAEAGSFAAAGRALRLSPQAVGRQLAALERRLGVALLNRTTRRQSLTEAGHIFLGGCRRMLAEAEAVEARMAMQAVTPSGTLRISVPTAFGSVRLMPALPDFVEAHPAVRLEIALSDRRVGLVEEGFDLAIRIGEQADSALISRGLTPYRVVPCAAPAYLARRGSPRIPAELAQHECLEYGFSSHPAPPLWLFHRGARQERVEPASRLRVDDGRALLDAALAGLGVVMAAEVMLRDHLDAGRLVRLLPGWHGPSRPMRLLFPSHRARTPKLRAFVDWAVQRF